jgi:type IV pilus assembly protein PilE
MTDFRAVRVASAGGHRTRIARVAGFTLIELMVVVAIVGILVGIALPSYQDSVRKSRRGQAKADLVELAQRAERYRTVNSTYVGFWNGSAGPPVIPGVATTDRQSPRGTGTAHYTITEAETANTFTLTATPQGGQTADTRCMTLTLNQAGQKTESGTATEIADCW